MNLCVCACVDAQNVPLYFGELSSRTQSTCTANTLASLNHINVAVEVVVVVVVLVVI